MYYQMKLCRHCTQMIPKFISLLDRKLTVKFYNTPWQASALGALITTLIAISRKVKCWPSHGKRLLLCTSTTWVQRISCVWIKKKTLVLTSVPTLNGIDVHTHTIICKANRMLGQLKRTCPLLTSSSVRRTLNLTHLRSQLCYASEVWSPNTVKLSKRVESVQRRATTWILNHNHGELTYQQRLICFDLLPLCYERDFWPGVLL